MGIIERLKKFLVTGFPREGGGNHIPVRERECNLEAFRAASAQGEGKKYIFILLTKYSDWLSILVYWLAGRGFTHTSIALGSDPGSYYSFNSRGFAEESLEKHRRKGERASCYRVSVPEEVYARIEASIQAFQRNKKEFQYSRLGVLCCVMGFSLRRPKKYFCSQFVAELLEKSQALALPRKSTLFQPNHFVELLEGHPACVRVM